MSPRSTAVGLALLATAALSLSACSFQLGSSDDKTTAVPEAGATTTTGTAGGATTRATTTTAAAQTTGVDVFSLAQGDCIDEDYSGSGSVSGDQQVVDCASPHSSEVFATKTMTDATFPGETATTDQADEFCYGDAFRSFVGMPYETSIYQVSYLYPTNESWSSGDREILCVVMDPSGNSTGTARGSNR